MSGSRAVAYLLIALCLMVGGGVYWIVRGVNRVLRQFAVEMAAVSGQVTEAAQQLAASSQSLAQGASEQAASLAETSAATEQVHSTTRSNAGHCQSASAATEQVNRQVGEANESLAQMIDSVHAMNVSSGKISQIIKGDRRDCFSNQHSGSERRGGSRPGRGGWHGLRSGGG
ncbi:MAG TPA: hypothetical protein VN924_18560 [Bryobacteraceae bacterium]|nr:hypothetical protein [Bryobacteraceae bacterium]